MEIAKKIENYTIDDIYALLGNQRAELIDGQLYMMAPPNRNHQKISWKLHQIIGEYIDSHDGNCEVYAAPFAVFLHADDKTYVEPDISVICDTGKLDDRGCNGAPDWVIEIVSPSTSGYDYVKKLNLYMDCGVKEYWIVDYDRNRISVYNFAQDRIEIENYTFQDRVKAGIYEDLEIDFSKLNVQ